MPPQNPALRFWDRLLPHFRERDWERCLRELRPVLDADEDALTPRLLCAGLHLAAAQPVLALLQYETLLPLAVGQGEFFAALAVQKRLDLLHPASVTHARRYEVLRRWFLSLGRGARQDPGARPGELSEATLLGLDAETFSRVMEGCRIEGLEPGSRRPGDGLESSRIVLYGRVSWVLRNGEGFALLEGLAEAGQAIAVDPEVGRDAALELCAELPSELLHFGPLALEALRHSPAPRPATAPRAPAAARPPAGPAPHEEAPRAAIAPEAASDRAAHARTNVPAAGPPRSPGARPRPDPRFEPFVASLPPAERRRESRVAINLSSGIARFGLADTRVAPLGGRLARLDEEHLELVFPRAELRHLRPRLEGGLLGLQLNFGPGLEPLRCSGRVKWTTTLGTDPEARDLRIEIQLLPLGAADRARLAEAGSRLARSAPGASEARAA